MDDAMTLLLFIGGMELAVCGLLLFIFYMLCNLSKKNRESYVTLLPKMEREESQNLKESQLLIPHEHPKVDSMKEIPQKNSFKITEVLMPMVTKSKESGFSIKEEGLESITGKENGQNPLKLSVKARGNRAKDSANSFVIKEVTPKKERTFSITEVTLPETKREPSSGCIVCGKEFGEKNDSYRCECGTRYCKLDFELLKSKGENNCWDCGKVFKEDEKDD